MSTRSHRLSEWQGNAGEIAGRAGDEGLVVALRLRGARSGRGELKGRDGAMSAQGHSLHGGQLLRCVRCGLDQGAARQQGTWANIPPKRNRKDSICFAHICRSRNEHSTVFQADHAMCGVSTRYDKLAANYLAFVKLASIRIWLRADATA